MGAGAVLRLPLAAEIAVGELPAASVTVAAAVVGMDDHEAGVEKGVPQRVPLVGMVPGGTAVDDDHPGAVVLARTEAQRGDVGQHVEAAVVDVLAVHEGVLGEVVRKAPGEPRHAASGEVDAEQVAGDPRGAESDDDRASVGREARVIVVAGADAQVAQLPRAQIEVQKRCLTGGVAQEEQRLAVRRPHRVVGVVRLAARPTRRPRRAAS